MSNGSSRQLIRGSAITALFTLVSRVAGFVRDLLMASLLGTGMFADAFLVAFRVPNLLRSFFAEGALTSGFVPTISDELEKGTTSARAAFSEVCGTLLVVLTVIVLSGIYCAPEVVTFFAPGYVGRPDHFVLTVELLRIMLPYILCISFVALSNAALNVHMIFGAASISQVLMNLVLIVGAFLAFYSDTLQESTFVLAYSVLFGGIIQVVLQCFLLRRIGFLCFPRISLLSSAVRGTATLMVPALFGGAIYQVTVFTNTMFASLLSEGSVSWLFYADRVAQLPVGIFTMAVASVLLPLLSRSNHDESEFAEGIVNALRYTGVVIIAVSGFLYLEAGEIVALLFERKNFTPSSTHQTTKALMVLSIGLWSMSCHSLLVRSFLAQKKPILPTLVSSASMVVAVLISLSCIPRGVLEENNFLRALALLKPYLLPLEYLGHVGLALSSTFSALVSFTLITLLFLHVNPRISLMPFFISTVQGIVGGIIAVLVIGNMLPVFTSNEYIQIIGAFISYSTCFLATLFIFRNKEFEEVFQLLKSKRG